MASAADPNGWTLLRTLSDTERLDVLRRADRKHYAKGSIVFHRGDAGDSIHLIARGRVAVRSTTIDGDAVTYSVLGPGDGFGELALLSASHRRTATVAALEPLETLALRRADFEALRERHAGIDRMLVEILALQVRRLSVHLLEALYVPVDRRVVRRLLVLCEQYRGDGTDPDHRISIRLTQTDLADMAGTTRPTVNNVLRMLEEVRVVARGRGRIEVLDERALRHHA